MQLKYSGSVISWRLFKPGKKGIAGRNESTANNLYHTRFHRDANYYTSWLLVFRFSFVFGLDKVSTDERSALHLWRAKSYRTQSVFEGVSQKSIPPQICQFFLILVTVKDKLTDLWGNRLLHNFFKNTVREIKSFWDRARPLRRTREALRAAGRTQGTATDLRQKSTYGSTFNPTVNTRVNFLPGQRMMPGV